MSGGSWKRTHSCGALRPADEGRTVTLAGWVRRVRDLGGITFVDLRDREGVTQIVVGPEAPEPARTAAKTLGSEWVVAVRGTVARRAPETVNPELATGAVEVRATELRVLAESKVPPFLPDESSRVAEETRLRYRYLDLRGSFLQRCLATRSRLALAARSYLAERGFLEIETPFLTKSTPEGARDYLVPSRVHKGKFYALPQSPQLFKQILMIAGMDRYFQIVRCFRDEDLRADRQPEFTQIDLEMSFVERDDVIDLVEGLLVAMFGAIGVELERPFPRLGWDEAMARYGSDRPDLRFGVEIADVSGVVRGSGYGVFEGVLEKGGVVRALAAPGCAGYSRKEIDALEAIARRAGARGLGWARWTDDGLRSPLSKHLGEERLGRLFESAGGGPGGLLLLVAGEPLVASAALGALRVELARREGWAAAKSWRFVWIVDFPLLVYDEDEGRWTANHHPFTGPRPEHLDRLETDPGAVRSLAYDVVANGIELGGGSIRIHRPDVQRRVFSVLGLGEEEAREKFGFFLEALEYGAPPHGGIALGLDRIAMLAAGGSSLRDVIAFPKTTSAMDLMTGSPSPVSPAQLAELGLAIEPQ